MASQVQQIFNTLKCPIHNQADILQVCVSSMCTENNRLCCLQCVDENHMGHQHVLISHQKFNKLVEEFHAVLKEKQQLNAKLLSNLKDHQSEVNSNINRYYRYIEESLVKENQLNSYQERNKIDLKAVQSDQLKKQLNEIIGNHSWMLELNAKNKTSEQQNGVLVATTAITEKYAKLECKLEQINNKCESQIKQVIQKRSAEVKKLFHLFDEIKYKIQDNGQSLQAALTSSTQKHHQIKTPQDSPSKQYAHEDSQKKKVKSVFSFLGNLVGGGQ